MNLTVPSAVGGHGAGLEVACRLLTRLATASTSSALLVAMPWHLAGQAFAEGLWEDVAPHLAKFLNEGALINSAASEPELGSPSRGGAFQTRLEPSATGFLLSGHKNWVTGGEHLDYLIVHASLDGENVQVLVKNPSPGVRWTPTWGKGSSLRGSDSHDVTFARVALSAKNLLPRLAGKQPNSWFAALMAAVYLGPPLAALQSALSYAKTRTPSALGKPIATLPSVQSELGAMHSRCFAAQAALLSAARRYDALPGPDRAQAYADIVAAKQIVADTALSVTDAALKLAGGRGISEAYAFERLMRDARGVNMHPPAGSSAFARIGAALLGDPEQKA